MYSTVPGSSFARPTRPESFSGDTQMDGDSAAARLKAVSYTHLDVYKRQPAPSCICISVDAFIIRRAAFPSMPKTAKPYADLTVLLVQFVSLCNI